jgi:uncharacterized protein (TIGR02246 family)
MRQWIWIVGATALIVAGVQVPATTAAQEGVQVVDAAWEKAVEANDLDAVMACYAADAVAWLPDSPELKGKEAIRRSYEGLFAANTIKDASFTETHYATVGDRSVGWGRFSLTLVPKGSDKPVVATGRFTEVAERRDGRWVYVVDHASADPAPAAAPKP